MLSMYLIRGGILILGGILRCNTPDRETRALHLCRSAVARHRLREDAHQFS